MRYCGCHDRTREAYTSTHRRIYIACARTKGLDSSTSAAVMRAIGARNGSPDTNRSAVYNILGEKQSHSTPTIKPCRSSAIETVGEPRTHHLVWY